MKHGGNGILRKGCTGQAYVNASNKVVHVRNIGNDCGCRRKCLQEVSENKKQKIFEAFYNLNSKEAGVLKVKEISCHRIRKPGERRKVPPVYVW
jgi:hypothetical protein